MIWTHRVLVDLRGSRMNMGTIVRLPEAETVTANIAPQVRIGDRVRFNNTDYDVAGVDGTAVFLTAAGYPAVSIRAADLLAHPIFERRSGPGSRRVARSPLFDQLPQQVRERAL